MTVNSKFDVIWIGTGQATTTVVPRLLKAGKLVAIIEGGSFGGTCVNSGCTPTKTLVASARALHMARQGSSFGFSVDGITVDFDSVMRMQIERRKKSSEGIERWLGSFPNSTVIRGYAKFVDEHTVEVDGRTISGDTIVINAGTRPVSPTVPGIENIAWLDNERILNLPQLPQHLVIVGGSYVALEFAQIFKRLGSEVTVLQRGERLVSREDSDISPIVESILRREGIDVNCGCTIDQVSDEDGILISATQHGISKQFSASHILFALGRTPNGDRLNVGAAGLQTTDRGHIPVNEVAQTSMPHIFALGDINGRGSFTHTSVHDGEVFWDYYARQHGLSTDLSEWDRCIAKRAKTFAMFIDPPLARVGMNEAEARDSGKNVLMTTMPMSRIARAQEKRETDGLVKILVDADNEEILGATVFGVGGDEIIGTFAAFMKTRSSYKLFRRVVFPHPTVSELLPWALDDLAPL